MTNTADDYIKGSMYEIFIHRANRKYDTSQPGTHCSVIQNLIRIENGDTSFVKWHGSFAKQLERTKTYMHKAMNKYLKMKKIPSDNLKRLEELNILIDRTNTTDDLMVIINESIELTQCVKDF
jgi:hypothetical protein